MSIEIEAHTNDLIKAGVLNLEDLEINRSGYLSARQKRWLYLNIFFWLVLVVADMLVFIPFIYLTISLQKNFFIGIILFGFLIMLIYLCLKNTNPYREDLKEDKPKKVNGRVFKHFGMVHANSHVKGSRIGYCNIRVGNDVFTVSPSAYNTIMQEKHYRIYFFPNTRKPINIEPL